jgi:hypothetical protein
MSINEVRDNNGTAARVDLKLEVVVIPVSMSTARRSSTGGSGGGSTPTTKTALTFV